MNHVLIIDNVDSFTHNLAQLFRELECEVTVRRCTQWRGLQAEAMAPDFLVIGPGPGDPSRAGVSRALILEHGGQLPILGVCLGLQCINEVFGGFTRRARAPVHGKTSAVFHREQGIFEGLPSPFRVARYHSLVAEPRGHALTVTAWTEPGEIMGLSHAHLPIHGVQFHPESFLTEHGGTLVRNFLAIRRGPRIEALAAQGMGG